VVLADGAPRHQGAPHAAPAVAQRWLLTRVARTQFELSAPAAVANGVGSTGVLLAGNPAVWLPATAGVLFAAAFLLLNDAGWVVPAGSAAAGPLRLALGAWALHYLPFALVARDCFQTYYVLAYYFAVLTLAAVSDLFLHGYAPYQCLLRTCRS
jgi:dolichyl-phosphate-mannose--protein O-mannosyl transferase